MEAASPDGQSLASKKGLVRESSLPVAGHANVGMTLVQTAACVYAPCA